MGRFAKLRWLGAALLLLAGCRSNDVDLKPAKQPDDFVPPPKEARYSGNIEYPKETLFTDVIKKDSMTATSPASSRTNAGTGMPGRPGF
jgi:hypothetical protein